MLPTFAVLLNFVVSLTSKTHGEILRRRDTDTVMPLLTDGLLRRYSGEGISYGKKLKPLQEDRRKEEELDQTMLGST
ncbi:MAG TPA: hypothetical protein VN958_07155 [Chitinophagaceae bacterium]|nr:hypothetical protein [Chitinophagaceae bacterium]